MKIALINCSQNLSKINLILCIILFSIMIRLNFSPFLVPTFSFSPLTAIALLSVYYFKHRVMVFLVPLLAVGISDCLLNKILFDCWTVFYAGWYWQYSCYLLITAMGNLIANQINIAKLLIVSLMASVVFYILSNFGVWCDGALYTHDLQGLLACYSLALPFFKNSVLNDLVFSQLLFLLVKYVVRDVSFPISFIKPQSKIFKIRYSAVGL